MKIIYAFLIVALVVLSFQPLPVIAQTPAEPPAPLIPLPKSPSHDMWGRLKGKNLPEYHPAVDVLIQIVQAQSYQDPAVGSPAFAKTAFMSYKNGNWEIFVGDGLAGNVRRITSNNESNAWPRLSRDGRYVVYTQTNSDGSQIYKSTTDLSRPKKISLYGYNYDTPSWEADNQHILYSSDRHGDWDIYRMRDDNSENQQLTNLQGTEWSPTENRDGTKIAWIRSMPGYPTYRELWVMDVDGSNQRAILRSVLGLDYLSFGIDDDTLYFSYDGDGDGYLELGLFKEGDSAVTMFQNSTMTDMIQGRQSPSLCYVGRTEVYYVKYNGTYYISAMKVDRSMIPGKQPCYQFDINQNTHFDLLGDYVNLDHQPPKTNVTPLPEYSSYRGFDVLNNLSDPGQSGINRYQLEYKIENGLWQDLYNDSFTNTASDFIARFNPPVPGQTVSFRIHALDRVWNQEPQPANAQTQTKIYTEMITGSLTDNRGVRGVDARVVIDPAAWESGQVDSSGRYMAHLNSGDIRITPMGVGLGAFSSLQRLTHGNYGTTGFSPYVPPDDNLIQNGDFESGTDGWNIREGSTFALKTENAQSGTYAGLLGAACSEPCLDSSFIETAPGILASYFLHKFLIDSEGNWHLFYAHTKNHSIQTGLYYRMRTPNGNWTSEEVITSGFPTNDVVETVRDKDDTVYVAWRELSRVYLAEKPVDSPWKASVLVTDQCGNTGIKLAVDNGNVWIAFFHLVPYSGLAFAERSAGSVFHLHRQISTTANTVAVVPDGKSGAHFLFSPVMYGGIGDYYWHGDNGRAPEILTVAPFTPSWLNAQRDATGVAHAFWTDYDFSHAVYDANENMWLNQPPLPKSLDGPIDVQIDASGDLYLEGKNLRGMYISSQNIPSESYIQNDQSAFDPSGRFLVFGVEDGATYYKTRSQVDVDAMHEISQTITIPPAMHAPTLAFDYIVSEANPGSPSPLQVIVEDESGQTTVDVPLTTGPDWRHFWYDLSRWAGKQVTIRLVLTQRLGSPYSTVLLDNISLGSWETPVITKITPDYRFSPVFGPETVTFTGENLISPTVEIDSQPFTPQFLDENTFQIVLNPWEVTNRGEHQVRVINQSGVSWLGTLKNWPTLFMPINSRD